jgi:hypothetical protein
LPADVFSIAYDPKKVSLDKILEAIRLQGFEGTVVPAR